MKKISTRSIFLISPIIIFLGLSEVITNYLISNDSYYKIDESKNILILGSSHSECSLNDSLIDHSINLSQSADTYFYTYYKLKKLIEVNPAIHTLILEYSNNVFGENMDNWIYGEEYLGVKYPKYSQLITSRDKLFLFYKNPGSYLIACKDALKKKFQFLLKRNETGYKNLSWGEYLFLVRDKIPQIKKDLKNSDVFSNNSNSNPKTISTLNILYLKKIVNFCKENNIKLILFRSPLHQLYRRDFESELAKLVKSDFANTPFWDYNDYPFEDYEFGDLEHLNFKGAKRLSKVVNLRLNQDSKLIQE